LIPEGRYLTYYLSLRERRSPARRVRERGILAYPPGDARAGEWELSNENRGAQ